MTERMRLVTNDERNAVKNKVRSIEEWERQKIGKFMQIINFVCF